jgi:hypothetical protein
MGMGEPLLNYEATVHALRILMDPEGFAVPPKKLTLSTVGILPALEKLMAEPVRPNLAISLHAPEPGLRRQLMPIEEKYRLEDVIAAAQRYPIPRGGRVTYEYVLLEGVNDSTTHARQLARRLRGSRAKVNLIPLNPAVEIPFAAPTAEAVASSPTPTRPSPCAARAGRTSWPRAASSTSGMRQAALQEVERPRDDLARAAVVVQDVEAVLAGGMGHQLEGSVASERLLDEAVDARVQPRVVASRPRDEQRRRLLAARREVMNGRELPSRLLRDSDGAPGRWNLQVQDRVVGDDRAHERPSLA